METNLGHISWASTATGVPPASPKCELFAGKHERQLASLVGLTQFGVNLVTLEPGSHSALRHWHEAEDEFVYVMDGELTLVDENGEHRLHAGAFAGFPAGIANAHHLINKSASNASFLVVGSRRSGEETIHYPDDGIATET
jgi:uncharacterized cupin superfamily protein